MGRSHAAAYFFLRVNITATLGLASGSVEICHKMNLSQESCSDVAAFADTRGNLSTAHTRAMTRAILDRQRDGTPFGGAGGEKKKKKKKT